MRHVLTSLTLLLALSACGGPSTGSPTPTPPGQQPPTPSPVGTPTGTPIQKVIGAAGGPLGTSDGAVRLDIPAGALSGDQTIALQPITRTAPGGTGQTYRLSPEGLTFATPARVTFTYTDEDIQGSAPQALSIGFQDEQGVWQYYRTPTRDLNAKTVSIETTHFSDWSMLEGVQLRPLTAEVEVGKTLPLQVMSCLDLQGDPDSELIPGNDCSPAAAASTAKGWAANGVAGGNASVGTVADTGDRSGAATYTAPAQKPGRNPVAVSVGVSDLILGTVTLVSSVTVTEPAPSGSGAWSGTITYREEGSQLVPANDPATGQTQRAVVYNEKQTVQAVISGTSTDILLKLSAAVTASDLEDGYTREETNQCSGGYVVEHWWQNAAELSGQATVERYLRTDEDGRLHFTFQSVGARGTMLHTDRTKVTAVCPPPDPSYDVTSTASNDYDLRGQEAELDVVVDPRNPDHLTGHVELTGRQSLIPTRITIDLDLTRRR